MTKQEKVAAFMVELGFEETMYGNFSGNEMMIGQEQSTFFYDVAEQARLETGKHVAFQIMDGTDPKGIYDAFNDALRHLKQEGKISE